MITFDEKIYQKSHRLDWITFTVDILADIMYIVVFFYLFSLIRIPHSGTAFDPFAINDSLEYASLLGMITGYELNALITLTVFLLLVNIPLTVMAVKKWKSGNLYEVNEYSPAAKFALGIISLVSFNPVSAGLRFRNTFILTRMTKGYGFRGFLQSLPARIKALFQKREKPVAAVEEDPESIRLKKSIRRQTISHALRLLLIYVFLVIVALFIFIPFYWMILTSLRTYYDSSVAFNPSLWISPSDMQWVNFKIVWEELDFGLYIKNTIFVGVMSTIGTIFTTVTAAYAFARLEFKGREAIFSVLIMTMMIPGELYIITNFMTVSGRGLGWVGMPSGQNEYFLAMIIPFMTSISYIFFLRQNFKQIPDSLYKAALVDGCSDLKYLTRVMIPIASPTIFTITILNVIGSWNAFIWPRLITSIGGAEGQNYWLISVALRDLSFTLPGEGRIMYNLQIAASALVTVPLLIVFLSLRKFIMNGIGRSGTKG